MPNQEKRIALLERAVRLLLEDSHYHQDDEVIDCRDGWGYTHSYSRQAEINAIFDELNKALIVPVHEVQLLHLQYVERCMQNSTETNIIRALSFDEWYQKVFLSENKIVALTYEHNASELVQKLKETFGRKFIVQATPNQNVVNVLLVGGGDKELLKEIKAFILSLGE